MLRNVLESLGDFFKNKVVDLVIGLFTAIFTLPQAKSLADFSQLDLRLVVIYVLVVIVVAGLFQVLGTAFVWLSELVPANIEVTSFGPEFERERFPGTRDTSTSTTYAVLSVINNEHSELTDCYAVLQEVKMAYIHQVIFLENRKMKTLWWNENKAAKTSIGPYGGMAQLCVFGKTVKYDDKKNKSLVFENFCINGNDFSLLAMEEVDVYEVRIEVHGKLNGKAVRAKTFQGYVEVNNWENYTGIVRIARGKPPSKEELYKHYKNSMEEYKHWIRK